MVQSLRSLCIEKVNNMRSDDEELKSCSDIPNELFRDMSLASLFNGTYTHKAESPFTSKLRALSIFYDGKSWTFGYKMLTTSYLGNPPTLKSCKVTLNLDETVGASYPCFDMKELLNIYHGMTVDREPLPEDILYMKTKIQVSLDDWKVGRVIFVGPLFKMIWRINVDVNGCKVLSHHGVVKMKSNEIYIDYLLNSMRFEETRGADIVIDGPSEILEEEEIEIVIEMDDNKFYDPETFRSWEAISEGALEDYWKIVEDEK